MLLGVINYFSLLFINIIDVYVIYFYKQYLSLNWDYFGSA